MERKTEEGGILEKKRKRQVKVRKKRHVSKVREKTARTYHNARGEFASSFDEEWAQG